MLSGGPPALAWPPRRETRTLPLRGRGATLLAFLACAQEGCSRPHTTRILPKAGHTLKPCQTDLSATAQYCTVRGSHIKATLADACWAFGCEEGPDTFGASALRASS